MSLSDKLIVDYSSNLCPLFCTFLEVKHGRGIDELFSTIYHGLRSKGARLSRLLACFEGKSANELVHLLSRAPANTNVFGRKFSRIVYSS